MFVCGGSISGFAATSATIIVPLKVVSATTVYAVETEPEVPEQSRDLLRVARCHMQAYRRARERLQTQAGGIVANIVFDVQMTRRLLEKDICELSLVGTAAKAYQNDSRRLPVVTSLTGQQYHSLIQHGVVPKGTAFGVGVYGQRQRPSLQTKLKLGTSYAPWEQISGERKDYTDAVKKAQRLAMTRLCDDAGDHECDGIIGIRLQPEISEPRKEGRIVTVSALGEAVTCNAMTGSAFTAFVPLAAAR